MGNLETFKMFVNGKWVDSENESTFESINPSIGKSWALIPESTANDVNNAVEAAYKAFNEGEWSKITPTQRGKYLRKLGDLNLWVDSSEYNIVEMTHHVWLVAIIDYLIKTKRIE